MSDTSTNTAGAIRNPYTPKQMGVMRLAARGLVLTATPEGCTIRGRTADDVRRLTGMLLSVGGNTAGAASAGWGIPKATGPGFTATLPPEAKKGLPFLDWNTAGSMAGAPLITARSQAELMGKIAKGAAKFGVARMTPARQNESGAWFVQVPAEWLARSNRASGNTAGAEGDVCPAGLTWSWMLMGCFPDGLLESTPPPIDTGGGGGGVPDCISPLVPASDGFGGCVQPGGACQDSAGRVGQWGSDGLCHANAAQPPTTTTPPIVTGRTPPTTTTPPVEPPTKSFWDGNGPYYGAAALALAAIGGGIWLGKRRKRGKNPPKGRKGKKSRKKK